MSTLTRKELATNDFEEQNWIRLCETHAKKKVFWMKYRDIIHVENKRKNKRERERELIK